MRLQPQHRRELTSCKADCCFLPHLSPNGHLHSHCTTLLFNQCQPGGRSTKWLVIVEAASTCKRKKLEAKSCNSSRQKLETKMLKEDAESSVCTYDKAMRSLPLHTSTQRCDRCTCTHAHTQLAQRSILLVHTPTQRYCFGSRLNYELAQFASCTI